MLLYLGGGDERECKFDNGWQRCSAVSTCASLAYDCALLQHDAQHACCAYVSVTQMSSKVELSA